jgi:hypothetical protein
VPGRSYEVIFPNGDYEIDAGTGSPPPAVGDRIRRRGKWWTVTATTGEKPVIVRVQPADQGEKGNRR